MFHCILQHVEAARPRMLVFEDAQVEWIQEQSQEQEDLVEDGGAFCSKGNLTFVNSNVTVAGTQWAGSTFITNFQRALVINFSSSAEAM